MTETSLVPLSAEADGLSVGEMYSGLVATAVTRGTSG